LYTAQTSGIGVLNLLEAMRVLGMNVKFYQASTSELFNGKEGIQNEDTPKDPVSPYGTAKLYGFQIAKNYREAFDMFICNGILFNHESIRRGDNFVTKKITNAVKEGKVSLGNMDASRDWGYAPEYCEAMWLMLQQTMPNDYVIATGETHTVKEFLEEVEKQSGIKIEVEHNQAYDRPTDVPILIGNPTKARIVLGWEAKTKMADLVKKMLYGDL
jgi:GDPmannose 4,6-dehydratase